MKPEKRKVLTPNRTLALNGAAWARLRRVAISQNPLCAVCESEGYMVIATDCDHFDNDASNNALDNLIGLCHSHHSIKTYLFANKERYLQLAMPFYLPKPLTPVTVVCGRPGSGKSTYVAERALHTDLVLDLDDIIAEMSGLPIYQSNGERDYLGALRLRNERLAALSMPNDYRHCWLIVSGKTIQERIFWRFKMHADVVIIHTSLDECLRRIESDTRRPNEAKQRQIEAARQWK